MIYLIGLAFLIVAIDYLPKSVGLHHHNRRNYMILCGFLITLVIGFRTPYTGSPDTRAYAIDYFAKVKSFKRFKDYYDLFLEENGFLFSESGFYYMLWLLTRIFDNGRWLVLISSAFFTFSACRFIYKNSEDPAMSLLIYVTLGLMSFNMNGMRQAFAMSICLFGYEFAKNRKLVKFLVTILIAMMFHKTALFFLPVYLIPLLKNSPGNWFVFIAAATAVMLSLNSLIPWFNDATGKEYSTTSEAAGGMFVVLVYLFAIVITFVVNPLDDKNVRIALFGTITGCVMYLSRYVADVLIERVSYYYFYFLVLLIPGVVNKLSPEEKKFVKVFFIIFAIALFSYRTFVGEFNNFRFVKFFNF